MDWGLVILVILLVSWGGIVYWVNVRSKKRSRHSSWSLDRSTPYEKYLSEHATDFNIRWQTSQIVRQKQSLRDALKTGDQVAAKVHRSMIVFGRSVVNHLWNSLKPK